MNVVQEIFNLSSRLDVSTELLGLKGISGDSGGVFYCIGQIINGLIVRLISDTAKLY